MITKIIIFKLLLTNFELSIIFLRQLAREVVAKIQTPIIKFNQIILGHNIDTVCS